MENVFDLYCPACGTLMVDVVFMDKGVEYPEKQCIKCLTIYQLGSASESGAMTPSDVILAPRDKAWLKKNGKEHFKGVLPNSW